MKKTTKLSLTILLSLIISLTVFASTSNASINQMIKFQGGSVAFGSKGRCKNFNKDVIVTLTGAGHTWKMKMSCTSPYGRGAAHYQYNMKRTIRPSAIVYKDLKKNGYMINTTGPGQPY